MAQITIYIPDELKRELRQFKHLNLSRAAVGGLRRALTLAKKEATDDARSEEEEVGRDMENPVSS